MDDKKKLESLLRHITDVIHNCKILSFKLIEQGQFELAKKLIAQSFRHDNSKFYGYEWEYIGSEDEQHRKLAINIHHSVNSHHPEYYERYNMFGQTEYKRGIHKMCEVDICELVCDWKARSSEFGSCIHTWIREVAMPRFGFCESDEVYSKIMYYLGLLLEKPFV